MVSSAREARLIPLTKAAAKFWYHLYLRLENDQRTSGFLGGMTSRGAAHIRRIAMILALVDREDAVDVKHLKAAEAIWDFSQESVRFIFVGYSLDQKRILQLAHEKGEAGIKRTDVHNLFKRNKEDAPKVQKPIRGLRRLASILPVSPEPYDGPCHDFSVAPVAAPPCRGGRAQT
jgi:hypothetical protein